MREMGRGGSPALGSTSPTTALTDPQSWMALLRKEIGHFHEKKELPLDTRWAWAWGRALCCRGHWA